MKRSLALLLLLVAVSVPAFAEVQHGTFDSPSLGRPVTYAIQLPPSYAKGTARYPVIYALHGLFESADFWETRGLSPVLDRMMASGAVPEVVLVAVDGGNSFFLNGPLGKYEDLVTKDLIAHVESRWRVVPGRAGRALWGISMGGYAALRIGLEHPETFSAIATHSAMVLLKPPTLEQGAGPYQMAAFHKAFGDPIDPALWTAGDPLHWADAADPKGTPAFYFDCGSEDRYGLFVGNTELHKRLEARGVQHEFALHPGGHGYEYVQTVIERSLGFLGAALRPVPAKR